MHPLRRKLPSLNHLYVVEAVARHLTFTAAALELGVSQPAISKSVRAVENGLGVKLFDRAHRTLALTPEGQVFAAECTAVLARLNDAASVIAAPSQSPKVRVSFSSSFVSLWLLPHLPEFKAQHPEIALAIDENRSDKVDLRKGDYDLSSRLGNGNWAGLDAWLLAPERVCAVASPDYVAQHPEISDISALPQMDLLHTLEPERQRVNWADWFRTNGIGHANMREDLAFSDYHSAIWSALLGQGVALGWEHLTKHLIAQGRLCQVSDKWLETGQGIYLVAPNDRPLSLHQQQFLDWMLSRNS